MPEKTAPEPDLDGDVRYPDIEVELVGHSSNAGAIIGSVLKALQRAGVPQSERDAFRTEATSGDYENVLSTALRWVDVS